MACSCRGRRQVLGDHRDGTGISQTGQAVHEALTDHLATLTEQDILEYYECFEKMHGALYRRDLWAAAYLIGGGCSDDSFIDFRAGLIAQGHDWYHKAAAVPDRLADHPAVAGARHPRCDNPLFYEEANYAASAAFRRLSGDEQLFWDALAARGPRDGLAELGEDFDFDDDQEMRRRLPRLFRSIHSASRDLSSTAWLTNKPRSLPSAASKGPTRLVEDDQRTAAAGQARCGGYQARDELYAGYTPARFG